MIRHIDVIDALVARSWLEKPVITYKAKANELGTQYQNQPSVLSLPLIKGDRTLDSRKSGLKSQSCAHHS